MKINPFPLKYTSLLWAAMFFLWAAGTALPAWATHNLAGQISAERIGPNRYRIVITTYTDPAPAGVDRCKADLEILNCDNRPVTTLRDIPRSNGPRDLAPQITCPPGVRLGVVVYTTVKRNIYDTVYTFPGPGCYNLRYYDLARREDITNIREAGNQTFYIETQLVIPNPIIGNNQSPRLLNEPLDEACVGKLWTHNPGGFDPEGDSLVYSLLPSLQYEPPRGINVPISTFGYRFPDDPSFGVSSFTINARTGLITWAEPTQIGVFNIAFMVQEYRNGQLLGYVIRDMVIFVKNCNNNPPIIQTIEDTCITAGEQLKFGFKVWDPDVGRPGINPDSVYLLLNNGVIGNNGPFAVSNAARIAGTVIDVDGGNNRNFNNLPTGTRNGSVVPDTIRGEIIWDTDCGNIRSAFYQVDFFAHDNRSYFGKNPPMLTAHKVVTIRVIPPRPRALRVEKTPGGVNLQWQAGSCPNVVGYNVYRKVGGTPFGQDTVCCDINPAQQGYSLIAYIAGIGNTAFFDNLNDLSTLLGSDVCYVVTAMYENDNDGLDPDIESCGISACVEIGNDKLYLTNDSVMVTDISNGMIFVAWSRPDSIDPSFEGPFFYRLYRANNNQYPVIPIADGLEFETDTTFIDMNLDTESRAYSYRVEVVNPSGIVFTSTGINTGSSIFLTATGSNGEMTLQWSEFVPWANTRYEVFRAENGGPFSLITTVNGSGSTSHSYQDRGLDEETEYCYFIRSFGSHNRPGIKDPLINDSQSACDFARDDLPPCPPRLSSSGNCELREHRVTITKNTSACADDTEFLTVYFSNRVEGPYVPLRTLRYDSLGNESLLSFPVNSGASTFAGCYIVTATDKYGNTSALGSPSCIDYCPRFVMSNVFSPNQDGINDILTPKEYRDVRLRQFVLFDRWGREVHRTNDELSRLWDGIVNFSGQPASEGVYYYYLLYDELSLTGNRPVEQKGWVMLLR